MTGEQGEVPLGDMTELEAAMARIDAKSAQEALAPPMSPVNPAAVATRAMVQVFDGWQEMTLPVEAWAELLGQTEETIRKLFDVPADAPTFAYRYEKRPGFQVVKHLKAMAELLSGVQPLTMQYINGLDWVIQRAAIDSVNRTVQITLAVAWKIAGLE